MRDGRHYKFWVYILTSPSGTLYVGVTGFFDRRIRQHKYDTLEGFTRKYQVHRLVYYESYQDALAAISREKQIKRWRREKDLANRETESALAGPCRELGRGNQVSGTVPRRNSLNQHRGIHILGISRLRAHPPGNGKHRCGAALEMTNGCARA